ncbi:T9SS type A sorting domain-containing protein [uncultured Winogradskyella sp.]|uniref:T9SS type A sorting domain-containing protein n=1 Tax=uncultured Winogradskyella sp. TaxID=395353 RepID=UPI0035154F5F
MSTTKFLCLVLFTCFFQFLLSQEIQRVRIDFQGPEGYTRQLLLAFTPDNTATDGFDYGYDALNIENWPDDLNWLIGDDRYIIQGVGAFSVDKFYRLGMFLSNSGNTEISLNALENFNESINVYIYDAHNNSYNLLNETSLNNYLTEGNYLDRFYVVFSPTAHLQINSQNALTNVEVDHAQIRIWYSNRYNALYLDGIIRGQSADLRIFNIKGQKVFDKSLAQRNSTIDMSNLNDGVYIAQIINGSKNYTTKFCVTK